MRFGKILVGIIGLMLAANALAVTDWNSSENAYNCVDAKENNAVRVFAPNAVPAKSGETELIRIRNVSEHAIKFRLESNELIKLETKEMTLNPGEEKTIWFQVTESYWVDQVGVIELKAPGSQMLFIELQKLKGEAPAKTANATGWITAMTAGTSFMFGFLAIMIVFVLVKKDDVRDFFAPKKKKRKIEGIIDFRKK